MLRVLAVDDEAPALEELLYLLREDPRIGRVEGATDATEAMRLIGAALEQGENGEDHLDVVFLDINMPGLSGLDTARVLTGFARPPLIVFVTAHENFAVQAFDLKAVDYVLKPVSRKRLAEAVRRVSDMVAAEVGHGVAGVAGAALTPGVPLIDEPTRIERHRGLKPPPGETIPVELGGVTRFVPLEQILYAEAQGDYARLHTAASSHLVRIPLSALERRWASWGFVRIHRRYLVALSAVQELRSEAGNLQVLVHGELLLVSRRHARDLRALLVRGQAEESRESG